MKLQRYNEVLLAVLGTGLLIALLAAAIAALWPRRDTPVGVRLGEPGAAAPAQLALDFCEPRDAAGTSFMYFPVAVVNQSDAEEDPALGMLASAAVLAPRSARYYASPGCTGGAAQRVTNVVIRDAAGGTERLLLSQAGLVSSVTLPDAHCAQGEGPAPCGVALWLLRMEDSNEDGRLNMQDTQSAWSSDLNGLNLRRLTPEAHSVESLFWFPAADELVFRVRTDSNADGQLTEEDGARLLITTASRPSLAGPAVGATTIAALERLLR